MSATSDLLGTVKIRVGLLSDARVSALDVDVDVDNGVARLTGIVDTDEQKMWAEEVASSVEGVVEVENEIVVESYQARTAELEGEALLNMPTEIPGMIGPARAPAAYGGPAPGVMTVLPPDEAGTATGDELIGRVWDALCTDERVTSRSIRVHADRQQVYIHGKVGSFEELVAVENIAAAVPGVQSIENDLKIEGEADSSCFEC
jgi:osmotically-inducible protein OsmY